MKFEWGEWQDFDWMDPPKLEPDEVVAIQYLHWTAIAPARHLYGPCVVRYARREWTHNENELDTVTQCNKVIERAKARAHKTSRS